MSFLSAEFGVFLIFGLALFYLSPAHWRPRVLLVLSYLFYATWSLSGTILLLGVTTGVHLAARWIESRSAERSRFALATFAVAALLLVLFVFKFGISLAGIFRSRPGSISPAILLIAPLGLSYYLFKAIGYLLDVYWEAMPAQRSFVSLSLYLSFFPQIVSGPIQRAGDFFGQYNQLEKPDTGEIVIGLRRILFGMFKKVVIADRLGLLVATTHAHPTNFSALELLLGAWSYSLQLYADFSGITDIAIGLGLLFGIRGPENFDLPYFASNIQVFWRRWHMSLTSWLTDYLFLPLRMSLRGLGAIGLSLAIMINMLAIGLWHGPRWTYAAFGVINGIFMIVSVQTLKGRNRFFQNHTGLARIRTWSGPLLTFNLMVFTHIFFSADSLPLALTYVAGIFSIIPHTGIPALRLNWALMGISVPTFVAVYVGVAAMEAIHWGAKQPYWRSRFVSAPRIWRWGLYYASILILALTIKTTMTFIYAQF